LAASFGIGALSPKFRGAGDDENELSVDFSAPRYLIPENFLGFSFETVGLFRVDIRKSNYNPLDYIAEWREFVKALRTRVPGAPLAGPDIAFDTNWLAPFIYAFGSEPIYLFAVDRSDDHCMTMIEG
jgi:hypothetical protein